MKYFFAYNWQIRQEWFARCKTISKEKLYEAITVGIGNFARIFFHIIKIEHNWFSDLQKKPIFKKNSGSFKNFNKIILLSKELALDVKNYVDQWNSLAEPKILHLNSGGKNTVHCTSGEVIRHNYSAQNASYCTNFNLNKRNWKHSNKCQLYTQSNFY
jgi:uncharacterized damage-inducible protein DinB